MKPRRYCLFAGPEDNPAGGWGDFVESFATLEDAIARGKAFTGGDHNKWFSVIDLETGEERATDEGPL